MTMAYWVKSLDEMGMQSHMRFFYNYKLLGKSYMRWVSYIIYIAKKKWGG